MKALFYRTFTVNQSSTMPALILLLLVCLIPIPWMQNAFWSKLLGSVPLLLLVLKITRTIGMSWQPPFPFPLGKSWEKSSCWRLRSQGSIPLPCCAGS